MEEKVKKRGWVKNVAIIFLAVLLFLTFMSNTIRNASLPEVAAQYVQSGTINAKIRGSGSVTPNESYEVKTDQTRKVQSVSVKVGDEVAVDDVLLLFADVESKELTEAEAALEQLMVDYKTALVDVTKSDYAAENAEINHAQAALEKAKVDRNNLMVSDSDLVAAKQVVTNAKENVTYQEEQISKLETQLAGLSQGGSAADREEAQRKLSEKENEVSAAQRNLNAKKQFYGVEDNALSQYSREWLSYKAVSVTTATLETTREELYKYIDSANNTTGITTVELPYPDPADPSVRKTIKAEEADSIVEAYSVISAAQKTLNTLLSERNTLQAALNALQDTGYSAVSKKLASAKAELTRLQTVVTESEAALTELKTKQTEYKTADADVTAKEIDLQNKLIALAEKQKTDGKSQSKEQIALADKQYKMSQQNEVIAKLKENATGASIKSPVNGKVTALGISAGGTTAPDTVLVTLEVPDRGYMITFSVTTEQSKKVKVGDAADILYNYSGSDKTAVLETIKSDPDKPSTNKLLVFKLSGEVESGEQLTLAIGEKGQYYETIVPNSAIKSDNNGSFVLVVEAKSSALGNRYIARRVDVKVGGADDVNTGVTGSLTSSDFVITTSNKPVEAGAQVRLAE